MISTGLEKKTVPGVYLTTCNCGKKYVKESSLKASTGMEQHKKTILDEKWGLTVISSHSRFCDAGFDWRNVRTLKVEERKFNRKVQEALEIQLLNTSPHSENGLNQDDRQYVTTRFWKPMFSYLREKTMKWCLTSHSDVYFQCVVFQLIHLYFAILVF